MSRENKSNKPFGSFFKLVLIFIAISGYNLFGHEVFTANHTSLSPTTAHASPNPSDQAVLPGVMLLLLDDDGIVKKNISPGGGQVESSTMNGYSSKITFPSGTFDSSTQIELKQGRSSDLRANTPEWDLEIGSSSFCEPVKIEVNGFSGVSGPVFFKISDTIYDNSGKSTILPQLIEAEIIDGKAVFYLPEHEDCSLNSQGKIYSGDSLFSSRQHSTRQINIRRSVTFWAVSGYAAERSDNFRVVYPTYILAESQDIPAKILEYAEEAYAKLKDMQYTFRSGINWPVQINVNSGMGDRQGEVSIPLSGKANISININENLCKSDALTILRATLGHEFFHVVQSVYDPRSGVRIRHAWTTAYFYWLGEASSVWFEEVMLGDPRHVADVFPQQIYDYHHRGLESYKDKQQAMERGYAASGFLRYLVDDKQDQSLVRKAWENVRAQGSGAQTYSDLRALINSVGSGYETGRIFARYMGELLTNNTDYENYKDWPIFFTRRATNFQRSIEISKTDSQAEIRASIEPFAAHRWRIYFEEVDPENNNFMIESVENDLSFYYHVYRGKQDEVGIAKLEFAGTLNEDEPRFFTASAGDLYVVVAVNVTAQPPYTQASELAVQLVRGNIYNVTRKSWHQTIQEAIDEAQEGDDIVVNRGTYREVIDFMGKNITLRSSSGPEATIIDGTRRIYSSQVRFASNESRDAVFKGFTLQDDSLYPGTAMRIIDGASPTITNNIIRGITINEASPAIINNETKGISATKSAILLENNNINGGITLSADQGSIIKNNTVSGNNGAGIRFLDTTVEMTDLEISGNTIQSHKGDLSYGIFGASNIYVHNSRIVDNIIMNNEDGGIDLNGDNNIIKNNTITNNGFDNFLSPGPGIKTRGKNIVISKNHIATNSGRGIDVIGDGVISENIINDNKNGGISIHGEFDVTGNEINNNITFDNGGGILIRSFEGGTYNLSGNTIDGNIARNGGGIYVPGQHATITGNTITNNKATGLGGGIYGYGNEWERTEEERTGEFRYYNTQERICTIPRNSPAYDEPLNNYSGNTHEDESYVSWRPTEWDYQPDTGYDVFIGNSGSCRWVNVN